MALMKSSGRGGRGELRLHLEQEPVSMDSADLANLEWDYNTEAEELIIHGDLQRRLGVLNVVLPPSEAKRSP